MHHWSVCCSPHSCPKSNADSGPVYAPLGKKPFLPPACLVSCLSTVASRTFFIEIPPAMLLRPWSLTRITKVDATESFGCWCIFSANLLGTFSMYLVCSSTCSTVSPVYPTFRQQSPVAQSASLLKCHQLTNLLLRTRSPPVACLRVESRLHTSRTGTMPAHHRRGCQWAAVSAERTSKSR